MKTDITYVPNLSIKSNYTTEYFSRFRTAGDTLTQITPAKTERELSNLKAQKQYFTFSPKSCKNLRNAIGWLIMFTDDSRITMYDKTFKFRLAFVTLTLPAPQRHTDIQIKRTCLNNFLIKLKEKHSVLHYVWRAERHF